MKKQQKSNMETRVLENVKNHSFIKTVITKWNRVLRLINKHQLFVEKQPLLRLMRLDKPAGFYLILLPCLWTLLFAANSFLDILLYAPIFILGALIIRGAGCVINDILDIKYDRQVNRTKDRPIASNEISIKSALKFLGVLLLSAALLLLTLPWKAVLIGISYIIPIMLYPLMKRFIDFPQVILGIVFNLGIFLAWFSVREQISLVPIMVYIASVFWTIGYDTIYALQDKQDDLKAGVKSLAIRLGNKAQDAIRNFYVVFILLILLAGFNSFMGSLFYVMIVVAAYQLYWQAETVDINDPKDCGKKFKSNVELGFIVLVGIVLGKIGI